jgi:hypothetical protein
VFRTSPTINRVAAALAVGVAVAVVFFVPTAVAQPTDGRSPDTRDAAQAAQAARLGPADGRSPDTVDATRAAQASLVQAVDGRSPDTLDAAFQAHAPVSVIVRSPGFQWSDFAVGVAAALGLILLVAGPVKFVMARHRSHRAGPVATA